MWIIFANTVVEGSSNIRIEVLPLFYYELLKIRLKEVKEMTMRAIIFIFGDF